MSFAEFFASNLLFKIHFITQGMPESSVWAIEGNCALGVNRDAKDRTKEKERDDFTLKRPRDEFIEFGKSQTNGRT